MNLKLRGKFLHTLRISPLTAGGQQGQNRPPQEKDSQGRPPSMWGKAPSDENGSTPWRPGEGSGRTSQDKE